MWEIDFCIRQLGVPTNLMEQYEYHFTYDYAFLTSWFVSIGDSLKFFSDFSSYWSQINILMAIAIERYILIVRGEDAERLLSKSRRRKLYAFTVVCIVIPAIVSSVLHNCHSMALKIFA